MDKGDLHNLFTSNEAHFNLFESDIKHCFHYWAKEDPPPTAQETISLHYQWYNVDVRCHLSGLLAPIFSSMVTKLHHP